MKKKKFIIGIDQGTTSSRAILFNTDGRLIFKSQQKIKQYFPKDGWVEQNPEEIWKTTKKVLLEVIKMSLILKGDILSIGITNQRETTILWDRNTSKPIYNAIVWQDIRTADFCKKFKTKKRNILINRKTGLFIDPYFSATKIRWLLKNIPKAKKLLKKKQLLFGTVDTFILWRLTKKSIHATDSTNASRTMLYNLSTNNWDNDILKSLQIPRHILPTIKDSSDNFGKTHKSITGKSYPITAILGDQHASLFGQCCFNKGSVKITYGTGAFLLINTGFKKIYSQNKLITTLGYRLNGKSTFALEGSIFTAGATLEWFKDKLKLIKNINEIEKIINSITDNAGVYLVPAFNGLGAPYWDSKVRGVLSGLSSGVGFNEVVRAGVESSVYQTYDLIKAIEKEGLKTKVVKIDGGMAKNNWFSQFLSDVLNLKVKRTNLLETTALGVAFMAGIRIGVFKSLSDISKKRQKITIFKSQINTKKRKILISGWSKALKKSMIR